MQVMDIQKNNKSSELLLPVGNIEMCLAAIHGGADAIYVGMPGFNARGRTVDHSIEQLNEIIELCHLYGVKVHVAFNILIFEDEINDAIAMLKKVLPLGPDALIIQDLGLAKIVKDLYPTQVIHASTQMTVTNHDAIEFLDDLEIERFVLGRENSINEIKEIRNNTEKELEVFVHGALCVAYSGQCFTSESIGGRSANRGQCAQSCRFSYELFVDGEKKQLVDEKYLVSPQDLCGINEVGTLQEIGIESFKVEGRLKSPAFVGTVAKTYKKAIYGNQIDKNDIDKMAQTYSRGFFSGWLHGVDHQRLVKGTYQSHRGVSLGQILRVDQFGIVVSSKTEIINGMGIVICNDKKEKEIGSPIFKVTKNKDQTTTLQLRKDFPLNKVSSGDLVYLNSNPEITKEVESTVKDYDKQKRIDVKINFQAQVGSKAKLVFEDCDGNKVEVFGEKELEPANKAPNIDKIKKDISALSRTPYNVISLDCSLSKELPFLHNKELKNLRQEAVKELSLLRTRKPDCDFNEIQLSQNKKSTNDKIVINILLRELKQVLDLKPTLEAYQSNNIEIYITLDFEFGKDYREALSILKECPNVKAGIATTRILKPGEYHHLNLLQRLDLDFILARNLGSYNYLRKKGFNKEIRGDFSLNVANSQTANYLLDKGFSTLSTSYDLNADQVLKLANNTNPAQLEITLHQYMPSFHMEHCVFAAFLSKGSSFKDCGKPCEKHQVELKDQFGNRHFIKADQECRNTMFNATAQSAISLIDQFQNTKIGNFRIELLDEIEESLINKVQSYLDYFNDKIEINDLIKNVNTLEKYGLGSGQLLRQDSYIDNKKN